MAIRSPALVVSAIDEPVMPPAIATQANANLAAVNYHFGSKEELFRAIFSRIARPIVVG